jgi:hypothetical protein
MRIEGEFLILRVVSLAQKNNDPSTQTARIGLTCGFPSRPAVANQYVAVASPKSSRTRNHCSGRPTSPRSESADTGPLSATFTTPHDSAVMREAASVHFPQPRLMVRPVT